MIVIVNYGMGNLGSIANMLKKAGHRSLISGDPDEIDHADKLIVPGIGAFDMGMANLANLNLLDVLNKKVQNEKVPTLGLCLGLQLFSTASEEGNLPGLGWIDMRSERFKFKDGNAHLKIPHMGWNTIEISGPHPLLEGLDNESRFYFVHSYHQITANPELVLARTEYGYPFASILGRENVMGVQFHPEKSHRFGMQLLKNFAERF
jgi:glutamine amidotransferase